MLHNDGRGLIRSYEGTGSRGVDGGRKLIVEFRQFIRSYDFQPPSNRTISVSGSVHDGPVLSDVRLVNPTSAGMFAGVPPKTVALQPQVN